jgi:transcriptional regulator
MYDLPYYKEKDAGVIIQFIGDHPFAFIAGCGEGNFPVATQVPVFIEEENGKKYLRGHIMKNTDHHKSFLHNPNVLVVFTGHHTYVSATWYSNPHQASTWNYMSVHVRGAIRFLDENALIDVLKKTSLHFEKNNKNSETIYDNLTDDYKLKLLNAIVAFEIEVKEMNHVFKLSQDRDKKSYQNIIEKLQDADENGIAIAREMKKRTNDVFSTLE